MHISCPSDKEDDKCAKEGVEKEEKEKNKEKAPKKMLSRGETFSGSENGICEQKIVSNSCPLICKESNIN